MSKKNVVLLLLIASIATVLVMTFFGMKAKLSEYTVFEDLCFYNEDNESICDENATVTTNITLPSKYDECNVYYFAVKYVVDRELDFDNLDFSFAIEPVGVNQGAVTIENIEFESYKEAFLDKDINFNLMEILYDENGDICNYVYTYFYKLTFNENTSVQINASIIRNKRTIKIRSIKLAFPGGGGGSSDIDL